jgi:hypothetical protein
MFKFNNYLVDSDQAAQYLNSENNDIATLLHNQILRHVNIDLEY